MDFLVVRSVQGLEDGLDLFVRHLELLAQDLLQLSHRDGPLPALVYLDEGIAHLSPLLVRQGPGHHRQARPAELRRLLEGAQRVDNVVVHAGVGTLTRWSAVAVLDEGVLESLLRTEPLLWVNREQAFHERLRYVGDLGPRLLLLGVSARLDASDLLLLGAAKRHVPHQEDKHDNAEAPEVALVGIALAREHIRADVGDGPAGRLHQRGGIPLVRKTKVNELQLGRRLLALVEEVLELQIPMHHAMRMKVADRPQHLSCSFSCICIGVNASSLESKVEFSTFATFRQEADVGLRLIDVVQPADIRVVEAQVYFHLGCELLKLRRCNLRLPDGLQCVPSVINLPIREHNITA
mmetsp:Transcript_34865/g.96401  ORF Transcript_34865/g.96401 Transcript_34865/m.96401 type:complete len:351 (-) Transcript_34865:272-1324(-)